MLSNKLRKLGLLASVLSSLMVTPVMAVEIEHKAGISEIAVNPQTTVVYDLALLDTMDALGIQANGVPTAIWPDFLEYYADSKKYPNVGTLFEPNYESVFALKPDLIMVSGRAAPKYNDLNKIAPTIDLTVDNANLVQSIKNNTNTLAKIFGKQDAAQAEIKKLDIALESIQKQTKDIGNAMLILTVGGKISAYGPGSRFGIIHDAFGISPAVKDLEVTNHGQAISFEFIHKNDPDWLFVIDRDAAIGTGTDAAKRLLDNDLIHKTKAWENDQIVYLNPVNWYILGNSGLQSLQASITEIAEAISK